MLHDQPIVLYGAGSDGSVSKMRVNVTCDAWMPGRKYAKHSDSHCCPGSELKKVGTSKRSPEADMTPLMVTRVCTGTVGRGEGTPEGTEDGGARGCWEG